MKLTPPVYWEKQSSCLRWRWNLGLLLDSCLKTMLIGAAILCPLVLLLRRWWTEPGQLAGGVVVALVISFVAASVTARKKFLNRDQSRIELEERLGLHNRLTSSEQGIGSYPPIPTRAPRLPGFHWKKLLPGPLLALLLLIAAFKIPLNFGMEESEMVFSKPPGLERVESWVKELKKQDLIEPEALEKLEQQAAELAGKEGKEWYRHGSLEAIDRLEERTQKALKSMEQQLGVAQQSLSEMKEAGMRGETSLESAQSKLSLALRGLEQKPLSLNPELAKRLKALSEGGVRELSGEQLDQMLKKLKEGQGSCQSCLGDGESLHQFATEGPEEKQPGNGGVDRGPGTAPITLTRDESKTGGSALEGLAEASMKRAALGSLLGVTNARHEKVKEQGTGSAGAVTGTGEGGQSVLEDELAPSEREFLKNFYQ